MESGLARFINFSCMESPNIKAMAALFCAIVAAQKSERSLPEFLRILPVSPEIKMMAMQSFAGSTDR